jgi:hypothetical protein
MPYTGYYITKDRLLQKSLEKVGTYDWLLHLAHKNWLAEEDIYALNTAFMAALECLVPECQQTGKLSLAKTLDEQQKIIRYKNELPNKGLAWRKLLNKKADKQDVAV